MQVHPGTCTPANTLFPHRLSFSRDRMLSRISTLSLRYYSALLDIHLSTSKAKWGHRGRLYVNSCVWQHTHMNPSPIHSSLRRRCPLQHFHPLSQTSVYCWLCLPLIPWSRPPFPPTRTPCFVLSLPSSVPWCVCVCLWYSGWRHVGSGWWHRPGMSCQHWVMQYFGM